LTSRECSGISWPFATLRRNGACLVGGTLVQTLKVMSQFEPLDISTFAWAFNTVKRLGQLARSVVASEGVKKIEYLETQPLATLVDVGLPGCELLENRLVSQVESFAQTWLQEGAFKSTDALLFDWQVDNFGLCGTAHLLGHIGINRPAGNSFEQRALEKIRLEDTSRSDDWRNQRFFFKERVYCYVEFALAHPAAKTPEKLQGSFVKENSFLGEGTRAGRTGLLRSTSLPINELVDRTLCAEFQSLSELCDLLDSVGITGKASQRFLIGTTRMWTSGASCLSCVGIMRQFLALFPKITLEVLCSKRLR